MQPKTYTITDGTLVLTLTTAEEGGYTVTCAGEPRIITEGNTIEECFEMAYDCLK